MSPGEQRIAIAESRGIYVPVWACDESNECFLECREVYSESINRLPDYLKDLNAMQNAETCAGMAVVKAMRFYLYEICDQMTAHHATAAQRAKAYLMAIGKWTD